MKTYTETRSRIDITKTAVDEKTGQPTTDVSKKFISEDDIQKTLDKLEKDGEQATVRFTQTFQLYKAETMDDVRELSGSESNIIRYWNVGAVLQQQKDSKSYLNDDDFTPVEGVFDLRSDLASESERGEKKTPKEKALGDLLKLSPEDFAAVLEAYRAAAEQKPAAVATA